MKQAGSATNADIDDLVERISFDDKLKNLNKKVNSNKTKDSEAEKQLTDPTNKFTQIAEKGYHFLLGRMHFINEDAFQNLFTFAPMFSLLILDSNRKIDWISTRISSEKINHLMLTLNLVNDRVNSTILF